MTPQDLERMSQYFEQHAYDAEPLNPMEDEEAELDVDDDEVTQRAAGAVLMLADGRVLLLKRSTSSDHPGEWCFPGGGAEDGESPREAAKRELYEEAGVVMGSSAVKVHDGVNADGVHFVTYLQPVTQEFSPRLNAEHTDWCWASQDKLPSPMHPGCAAALESAWAHKDQ